LKKIKKIKNPKPKPSQCWPLPPSFGFSPKTSQRKAVPHAALHFIPPFTRPQHPSLSINTLPPNPDLSAFPPQTRQHQPSFFFQPTSDLPPISFYLQPTAQQPHFPPQQPTLPLSSPFPAGLLFFFTHRSQPPLHLHLSYRTSSPSPVVPPAPTDPTTQKLPPWQHFFLRSSQHQTAKTTARSQPNNNTPLSAVQPGSRLPPEAKEKKTKTKEGHAVKRSERRETYLKNKEIKT